MHTLLEEALFIDWLRGLLANNSSLLAEFCVFQSRCYLNSFLNSRVIRIRSIKSVGCSPVLPFKSIHLLLKYVHGKIEILKGVTIEGKA